MIDYSSILAKQYLKPWRTELAEACTQRSDPQRHGDLKQWLNIVNDLPDIDSVSKHYNRDTITIGEVEQLDPTISREVDAGLRALIPWRKGPYQVFDTFIDTEWRSDWKWQRAVPHLPDLDKLTILDVGCGSGYHCWRMLGAGADRVLGIDPSMRFQAHYLAIQKYAKEQRFDFLPLGIEDLPTTMQIFDGIFSMGILYHRRRPKKHIEDLYDLVTPGGFLLLETLVVDPDMAQNGLFRPKERYAQMRNVWSITTIDKTMQLLDEVGFTSTECVNVNLTSTSEQRSTDWMTFHSLADFLDPSDQSKTVEGYPAPCRAMFMAYKRD
ncbi:MAG: tRNA 5-methoxyuridine(34)/uridine 5-oxyacetic acid(34) synthase CmoB [Pseudomonadota bacterium]